MEKEPSPVVILVRHVLTTFRNYKWHRTTTGVFATYFKPDSCINLYYDLDIENKYIHSHPFDFRSYIVAGVMRQTRYVLTESHCAGHQFRFQERALDGHFVGEPQACRLVEGQVEKYVSGDSYEITTPEIHSVAPDKGTVTFVLRQHKTNPAGFRSCWPLDKSVVTQGDGTFQRPEASIEEEVAKAAAFSLEKWF